MLAFRVDAISVKFYSSFHEQHLDMVTESEPLHVALALSTQW